MTVTHAKMEALAVKVQPHTAVFVHLDILEHNVKLISTNASQVPVKMVEHAVPRKLTATHVHASLALQDPNVKLR